MDASINVDNIKLTIDFWLASKGGGDTVVQVHIPADSFSELSHAMMRIAPKEATRAFAKALISRDAE